MRGASGRAGRSLEGGGPKQRAKTDAADARHLRELLEQDGVPESWIPPTGVREARALVRLYKDLTDERVGWAERICVTLFHQGVPRLESVLNASGRALLPGVELSPAGRSAVEVGLRQIERLSAEIKMLSAELRERAQVQPWCRALVEAHYGVGPILAFAIWAEMGIPGAFPRLLTRCLRGHRYHGLRLRRQAHQGALVSARPLALLALSRKTRPALRLRHSEPLPVRPRKTDVVERVDNDRGRLMAAAG